MNNAQATKPCDLPRPVAASLTALWDAVNAADDEICKAIRENSPPRRELNRLQEEFTAARHQLVGILLETLAPEPDYLDGETEEEEALTADAGHMAARPHDKPPRPHDKPPRPRRAATR